MDPWVRCHGMKAKAIGYLWSKYECFLTTAALLLIKHLKQTARLSSLGLERTQTNCDEARDYVVSNVLSPRDLFSGPDNMDETVLSSIWGGGGGGGGRGLFFSIKLYEKPFSFCSLFHRPLNL